MSLPVSLVSATSLSTPSTFGEQPAATSFESLLATTAILVPGGPVLPVAVEAGAKEVAQSVARGGPALIASLSPLAAAEVAPAFRRDHDQFVTPAKADGESKPAREVGPRLLVAAKHGPVVTPEAAPRDEPALGDARQQPPLAVVLPAATMTAPAGPAPGLTKRDTPLPAADQGLGHLSERAAERTLVQVGEKVTPPSASVSEKAPQPSDLPLPTAAAKPNPSAVAPTLLEPAPGKAATAEAPGRSEPPIAFRSPHFAREVGQAVARLLGSEEPTGGLTLDLAPPRFGAVEVAVQAAEQGGPKVLLGADRAAVLEQLAEALPAIRDILANAGFECEVGLLPQLVPPSLTQPVTQALAAPLQPASARSEPPAQSGSSKDESALGSVPGLSRKANPFSAADMGVERRSERATERSLLPASAPDAPLSSLADALAPVAPLAVPAAPETLQAPTSATVLAPAPQVVAEKTGVPSAPATIDPPLSFTSPRFAEDVGLAIARRLGAGEGVEEMLLRIEPADLGRIQITLRFDEQGGVQAVLSADQPKVLEQLRLGGAELQRAMADAGFKGEVAPPRFEGRSDPGAGQGSGSFSGMQQGSGQGQGQNSSTPQHQQRSPHFTSLTDLLPELAPSFVRMGSGGGRIDLLA